MDMNEEKNAADYKDFILPPASLTATQGESKAVVLTWPAVKNAVQYQVFAAESPFSTFSKVSETTSTETEITIEEEAGITKYYCISAVNYYGTVSSKSVVAMGSTLAVPIITAIDASEEGNSVTVSWWMDNCSSDTYAADVSFNVNVYALSAPNIKFKSLTVDGDTRQVEIDGLTSKTEYYFEVEVVKTDSTSKECSEKTSAETAHRVIPDAPLDFTVTQGDSVSAVTLSWTLPEETWYRENAGVSGFALHPLYFVIYRKLSSAPDSDYKKVKELHYDPYEAGTSKTWDDELYDDVNNVDGVERGKKYSYYIQSITDDTPEGKTITAESSKTDVIDGWLITEPRFSISSTYTPDENDNTLFKEIEFSYQVEFETFGKEYTYFVIRANYDSDKNIIDYSPAKIFNSLSEFKGEKGKEIFKDLILTPTYYRYTLYICPSGAVDNSNSLITLPANGYFLVTSDASAVPTVSNFTLKDGYKNQFALSWDYKEDYRYIVHWTDVINNVEQQEQSLELIESDLIIEGNDTDGYTAKYNHPAESGDRRIYTLEASTGLSYTVRPNGDSKDEIYETLGTAQPKITSYEYDKICVEWPAVQKAKTGVDDFSVSAKYQNTANELVITDGENKNIQITIAGTENEPVYKCIISKPDGYNDADWSGKKIDLTVTATTSSENVSDSTTSTPLNVYTIGPAATEVLIDQVLQNESIGVKWKPVEAGVDGYLIRRVAYKTTSYTDANLKENEDISPDIYYYNISTDTLSINGETVSSDRASVSFSGGYFRLTDCYKEASSAENPYEVNQSYIAWGIPFGYTVIPVKEGGSSNDDFIFSGKIVKIKDETEGYSNIKKHEYFGSTTGYGLKVYAEKSESADTQVIRWNKPYSSSQDYYVYYRKAGTNNEWKDITFKPKENVGEQMQILITPETKTDAYEYIVAYNKDKLSSVPQSLLNDNIIGLSMTDEDKYNYNGVAIEKANKGYLLAVDYSAETGSGEGNEFYSEFVNWKVWDYETRSIGPTSAKVRILNYNISTEWVPVAELDNNLHFVRSLNPENTKVEKKDNVREIKLYPISMFDGTKDNYVTKGPLQVLRDAKHYYSLELFRGDKSVILDNSVYAYREISEKELVKCALLTMAYGFYSEAGGAPDYSNINAKFEYKNSITISGGKGNAFFQKGDYQVSGKYNAKVTMDNFAPLQKNPAGKETSVVSVSMSNITIKIQGTWDYYIFKFDDENFTVSVKAVNDDSSERKLPSSYTKDMTMKCTGSNNLKIVINNQTIVDTSDETIRKIYFPIQLHKADSHYWLVDSTYGWWPNN